MSGKPKAASRLSWQHRHDEQVACLRASGAAFCATSFAFQAQVTAIAKWHPWYVRPLSYYVSELEKRRCNCPQVHLVSAASFPASFPDGESTDTHPQFPKSLAYIDALRARLCALGFKVVLPRPAQPDEDFALMVRAREFIPSGGGFSRLVESTRAARGFQDQGESRRAREVMRSRRSTASVHGAQRQ